MNLHTLDAIVAHTIALMAVSGFLGIGYVAVLGFIDLKDPVVTGFVGTLIGSFGSKAEVAMARYFERKIHPPNRDSREPPKKEAGD